MRLEGGDVGPEGGQVDLGAARCRVDAGRRGRRAGRRGPHRSRSAVRLALQPAELLGGQLGQLRAAGSTPGCRPRRTACSEAPSWPPRPARSCRRPAGRRRPRRARRPTRPERSRPGPGRATSTESLVRAGDQLARALEQHGGAGLGRPRPGPRGPGPRSPRRAPRPSSVASSPACGVSSQLLGQLLGQVLQPVGVHHGRQPRRPAPAASTSAPSGRSPQPEPNRCACTRPGPKTTFGSWLLDHLGRPVGAQEADHARRRRRPRRCTT